MTNEPGARARVLFVDDDTNLLQAVARQQRRHFDFSTSDDPHEALRRVHSEDAFSVVVADLEMPGMDGIEFLKRVERASPDSTRIMLTGNADLESATRAVNDGHIFRFLTKPCQPQDLREAIRAGAKVQELVVAERDLLERTLRGAVEVLTETLGLVNPAAFGRASRVRRCVRELAKHMKLPDPWRFEVAAMLSQVGCVTVPAEVVGKAFSDGSLTEDEARMVASHPGVGCQLIRNIPRLEEVAEMIGLQHARFDGKNSGPNSTSAA